MTAEPAMTTAAMTTVVLRRSRDGSHDATGSQGKRGIAGDAGHSEFDVHDAFSSSSITLRDGSSVRSVLAAPIANRSGPPWINGCGAAWFTGGMSEAFLAKRGFPMLIAELSSGAYGCYVPRDARRCIASCLRRPDPFGFTPPWVAQEALKLRLGRVPVEYRVRSKATGQ